MPLALLVLSGGALLAAPEQAPVLVAFALVTALVPLASAWRAARGTELRAAVLWGVAAVMLGIVAELAAWFERLSTGRPAAGHVTYLAILASFAALVSVLGARSPGAGAWALLMSLLILVLLVPWLEAPTLLRKAEGLGQLRLEAPWSLFYGLLVLAGVTNYLPTRYGPAALCLGIAFGLEYIGLAHTDWPRSRRALVWTAVPWFLPAAAWIAALRADACSRHAHAGLEAIWLWFRDHWGVVWALRVQERFNRSAEAAQWPLRLTWYGIAFSSGQAPAIPEAAVATLKSLLRRFATAERLEAVAQLRERRACDVRETR